IEGKIAKWLKEVCLLEQESVIESDKTVEALRANLAKELGADITLARFARFQLGEGIEKPTAPDFAAEVAKMAGGGDPRAFSGGLDRPRRDPPLLHDSRARRARSCGGRRLRPRRAARRRLGGVARRAAHILRRGRRSRASRERRDGAHAR